jgi:hypothetical protein
VKAFSPPPRTDRTRPAATHWHASAIALPLDTILSPRPDYEMRWHSESAGRILEDGRPSDALAHREAVFMCEEQQECDDCGAACEWLFGVVPEGPVTRHDLSHASAIDCLLSEGASPDEPAVRELVRRYWEGEPSELPCWEHLARSARIVSVEPW